MAQFSSSTTTIPKAAREATIVKPSTSQTVTVEVKLNLSEENSLKSSRKGQKNKQFCTYKILLRGTHRYPVGHYPRELSISQKQSNLEVGGPESKFSRYSGGVLKTPFTERSRC